jgi:hypothetical protein
VTDRPSVEQIKEIRIRGPWKTKSDALLRMLFAFSQDELPLLFRYDDEEVKRLPRDIRGLRSYHVKGLGCGTEGAKEFHRIRTELILALSGEFDVVCRDTHGNEKVFRLKESGVIIPPYIWHKYVTLQDGELLVVANTTFDPEDPETHDSYPEDLFRELDS